MSSHPSSRFLTFSHYFSLFLVTTFSHATPEAPTHCHIAWVGALAIDAFTRRDCTADPRIGCSFPRAMTMADGNLFHF